MGVFSQFLDPHPVDEGADRPHFYCSACGEITTERFRFCPRCGQPWAAAKQPSTRVLVEVLEDLHTVYDQRLIAADSFQNLRRRYETMLVAVRPERIAATPPAHPPAPAEEPAFTVLPVPRAQRVRPEHGEGRREVSRGIPARARPDQTPAPLAPPPTPPRPPRRPLGELLAEWTAARQADILLYLGAFLLSIAALILVGFQGSALSGPARFAILASYTVGFLVLGLALPRWERVREAGSVFLGLGAILVPIDFIALRTQVLGGGRLPNDVILLAGAAVTAALYFTLALRGHGRWYALPGSAATVVAWGALGSVLGLGLPWLGMWYVGGAAVLHIAVLSIPEKLPYPRLPSGAAAAIAGVGILYAHAMVLEGDHRAQLPLAHALLLAGIAAEVWRRRSVLGFALLPASANLTVLTTLWAAVDLPPAWFILFAALAGLGYLAVSHFDKEARAIVWLGVAAGLCGSAVLFAHAAIDDPATSRGILPATYTVALVTAAAGAWRWRRRDLLATVPVLAIGTGAGTLWAFGRLPVEWLAVWGAAAALSYLLIADRDGRYRPAWRATAAAFGAGALAWAHLGAIEPAGSTLYLPLSYALLLGGALWDGMRRRDPAQAAIPPLASGFAVAAAWSLFDLSLVWLPCFVAAAAFGYLLLIEFNPPLQREFRRFYAAVLTVAAIAAYAAYVLSDTGHGQLPAVHGLLLAAALWDGYRRRDTGMAVLPALAAGFGGWTGHVAFGMSPVWTGAWVAAAAAGYLLLIELVAEPAFREFFRWWYAASLTTALAAAYAAFAVRDTQPAQLPVTHALALLAALWDSYRRRDLSMSLLPPLAAGLGGWTAHVAFGMGAEWTAAWVAAAAAAYLVTVEFAPDARVLRSLRWCYGATLAAALVTGYESFALVTEQRWQLPVVHAILLAASLWDGYRRRDTWLIVTPVLAGALGAWTAFAAFDIRTDWAALWIAGMAAGYLLLAEVVAGERPLWRISAGAAALSALTLAHLQAYTGEITLQLPLTYALVFALAVWDSSRRSDMSLLTLPPLGALTVASTLWAAGAAPVWWVYPGLAAAAIVLLSESWWRRRADIAPSGWPYVLLPALILPVLWLPQFPGQPAHGVAVFVIAAVLVLVSAFRSRGQAARSLLNAQTVNPAVERRVLVQGSSMYANAAAAYVNLWAGFTGAERAWIFIGIGLAVWAGIALFGGRVRSLLGVLASPAIGSLAVAAGFAIDDAAILTAVFAAGVAGPLAAFPATRRWLLIAGAVASGAVALATFWSWQELTGADLPIAYAAAAAALWGGFTWVRTYERSERGRVITLVSWAPWLVALLAALAAVASTAADLAPGGDVRDTRVWTVLALVVALAATAVTVEGIRLHRRPLWIGGAAGIVLALLLMIARTHPANVQAYTLPVGLYLVVIGLIFRRSQPLFGPHLSTHEATIVLGLLLLVLPPAQQSFAPGGAPYGLELIGMGVIFLLTGLLLSARWLVAGGVLTLSGVAIRWLTIFSTTVPYWITLGLIGTLLVVAGVLLLLQRERWEHWVQAIAGWWATPHGGGTAPHGRA